MQILTVQICKSRRFLYTMKATGIVRRIDEYIVINEIVYDFATGTSTIVK